MTLKNKIFYAAERKPSLLKRLLCRSWIINIVNVNGSTPLHCAASHNLNSVKILINVSGIDINKQDKNGWTPLHCAAKNNLDIFYYLIHDQRINGDLRNSNNETAYDIMLKNDYVSLFKNEHGASLLHYAAKHNPGLIIPLISKIDINCVDNYGSTPLHYAASHSSEALKILLSNPGIEINKTNNDLWTPFDCAAKHNIIAMNILLSDNRLAYSLSDYSHQTY